MIRSCSSVVKRKTWSRKSGRLLRVQTSYQPGWNQTVRCWTETKRNILESLPHSVNEQSFMDYKCVWCIRLSFVWWTPSESIFWQSIKFETAYLQRYQKLFFSCGHCVLQPSHILRPLLHAFITCRLDYSNSLPVGLPACDVSDLQSVQNVDGRLFDDVSRYDFVEHVLRDKHHWLPVV